MLASYEKEEETGALLLYQAYILSHWQENSSEFDFEATLNKKILRFQRYC
jgi:hypothetical protein